MMDTSPEYIKMCEEAEEIQKLRQWEYGDCFIQVYANGEQLDLQFMSRELSDPYYGDYPICSGGLSAIWLPRQDQLQEMVNFERRTFDGNAKKPAPHNFLDDWLGWLAYLGRPEQFTSMEQLWLAFVMSERYQKTWTREGWQEMVDSEKVTAQ